MPGQKAWLQNFHADKLIEAECNGTIALNTARLDGYSVCPAIRIGNFTALDSHQ